MKKLSKSFATVVGATALAVTGFAPVAFAGTPTLSSTSPAALSTGVAIDANVVLTFSEAVSAESGQISIYKWTDKTLFESIRVSDSSKVSLSGAVVTINPTKNFDYGTRYYVFVDSTAFQSVADDVAYGGIQSEGTLNFTTAAAPVASTTTTTVAATTTVALPRIGGTTCAVAGRTRTVGGTRFVCKKSIKLVWRRA
jgi:methionine-rich copper-binding protein CopC